MMGSSEVGEFGDWDLLHDSSDSESGHVLSVDSSENVSDDISVHSAGEIYFDDIAAVQSAGVNYSDDIITAVESAAGENGSDEIAAAQLVGEKDSDDIDAHSEGMIQANYFSIEAENRGKVAGVDVSEEGSESSDNPSWIDPASENRYPRKGSAFWSDSGSERSDDRRVSELELGGGNEVGDDGNEKRELVGFHGTKEIRGSGEEKSLEKFEQFWSDSGGIGVDSVKASYLVENIDLSLANPPSLEVPLEKEEKGEKESVGEDEKEGEPVEIEPRKPEIEKKWTLVWWKVPMQFMKYCVFKVSPVWSFSVVAAVLGFVILGRRLQKMKKKTRGLDLKVTMDDKVSPFPEVSFYMPFLLNFGEFDTIFNDLVDVIQFNVLAFMVFAFIVS